MSSVPTLLTFAQFHAAYDFSCHSGCKLVEGPTHFSGNRLDLFFTDIRGLINASVGTPTGSSDHSSINKTFQLKFSVPDFTLSHKDYLK